MFVLFLYEKAFFGKNISNIFLFLEKNLNLIIKTRMKKLCLFLVLSLLCIEMFGQDEMFKSLFIYNFTKNIEWPDEYKSGDFIITVVGNSQIIAELEKIAKLKKVGSQNIVVMRVYSSSEIGKSHMVYISPSKSSELNEIISKTSSTPTVIIGDKEGLAKDGAGLNFIKVDGKQKFEINTGAIERNGLKVNNYLTTLGIVVQ